MNPIDISIPAIPVGVLVLLNFFAPYATAIVIDPRWPVAQKKLVAVITSIVLAAVVLLFAWWMGSPVPAWPALILLAVVVSQASYDLVTKRSADALSRTAGSGARHLSS
jgi:hypothetical protein